MGKRAVGFLAGCLMVAIGAFSAQADQNEENLRIEQVNFNAPEIEVYGYNLDLAGETPKVLLSGKELESGSPELFKETGEGIHYYILFDISNSIPDTYFSALKKGILQFCGELGPADGISLITFGEEVALRYEGASGEQELQSTLEQLDNNNRRTLLFEAVSKAVSSSRNCEQNRKVIIVISDGENVADGNKQAQEALEELKKESIPVYGVCIEDTARENKNSFGEFARTSGGDLTVFNALQAEDVLSELRMKLMGAQVMRLYAESNRITNKYETLSIYLPEQEMPVTSQVFSGKWIPDTVFPEITAIEQLDGNKIKLTFSEEVEGLELAANYVLKKGEKRQDIVPISGVTLSEDEKNTVILTSGENLGRGVYTLSCLNIYDRSQEKNPVSGAVEAKFIQYGHTGILVYSGIVVGVVAFVGIIIALMSMHEKLNKRDNIVNVNRTKVPASSGNKKHHVEITPVQKKKFEMLVTVNGKNPAKLDLEIDKSLIVGRSDICDVYFDDDSMSRQHFALEWDGTDMYITDLETTNGTSVDGIRMKGKRKLDNGALVNAGREELRIRW